MLAVRGRFTDTANDFVRTDAAIFGNPYLADDDTERTKTFDNPAIQSHNHCQRKQKIGKIRANAARVSGVAHYEAAEELPYQRFIIVHYPPKLEETVIEITETPKVSLRNMTIEFSGIVVPRDLFSFAAVFEEGLPPNSGTKIDSGGVPVPVDFNVTIQREVVSGGAQAAYAKATWTLISDVLTYEFEWEPTDLSSAAQSVLSDELDVDARSLYLVDGKQYRFRLRAWGGGTSSDWTGYVILTATADETAPGVVTGASATGGVGQGSFNWTAPNSPNYAAAQIYINTVNSFSGATLMATEYGPANIADSRVVTGLTAGTKYGFIRAINTSGVAAAAVSTGSFVVS